MTDDERREVAVKLRDMACRTNPSWPALMEALGCPGRAVAVQYLADLIEPEERTCRAGVFPDGAGAYVICCTECGYAIGGTWSDLGTARRIARAQHKFTNFCPNCGARVVEQ